LNPLKKKRGSFQKTYRRSRTSLVREPDRRHRAKSRDQKTTTEDEEDSPLRLLRKRGALTKDFAAAEGWEKGGSARRKNKILPEWKTQEERREGT